MTHHHGGTSCRDRSGEFGHGYPGVACAVNKWPGKHRLTQGLLCRCICAFGYTFLLLCLGGTAWCGCLADSVPRERCWPGRSSGWPCALCHAAWRRQLWDRPVNTAKSAMEPRVRVARPGRQTPSHGGQIPLWALRILSAEQPPSRALWRSTPRHDGAGAETSDPRSPWLPRADLTVKHHKFGLLHHSSDSVEVVVKDTKKHSVGRVKIPIEKVPAERLGKKWYPLLGETSSCARLVNNRLWIQLGGLCFLLAL